MTIGDKIKETRKHKHISQRTLGEKLGVSAAMIGQYETGVRNPKLETIQKIAEALNVTPSYLMGWDEEKFFNDFAKGAFPDDYEHQTEYIPNKYGIIPKEFNAFARNISEFNYSIHEVNGVYFLADNGENAVKITPEELKTLMQTSRDIIRGLLDGVLSRGEKK